MADELRNWLVGHEGDDFAVPPTDHPYSVVPAPAGSDYFLYTTKPRSVLVALSRTPAGFPCGVIGRYGLPSEDELRAFESLVVNRRLVFLGDADPCDLLIFGWLRSRIDISFRGINDSLLERCGVILNDRVDMAQSDAEVASMSLIAKYVPDYTDLLGPVCAKLLASGRKVELESLSIGDLIKPESWQIWVVGGLGSSTWAGCRRIQSACSS